MHIHASMIGHLRKDGEKSGRGAGRRRRSSVVGLVVGGLLLLGGSLAAQEPVNWFTFRNLGASPVRVYLEDDSAVRFVGRVTSMGAGKLRIPSDVRIESGRAIRIAIEPIGAASSRLRPGGAPPADEAGGRLVLLVPTEELTTQEWTLSGQVLYSSAARTGRWVARTEQP